MLLKSITSATAQISMMQAVSAEIDLTGDKDSIVILGDGSWRKRGFSSLQGIVAVIGNSTGKILDVNIRSSYCNACKIWEPRIGTPEYADWLESHEDECQQNHNGSAGKMEVDGMLEIFHRSVEKYDIKYKLIN